MHDPRAPRLIPEATDQAASAIIEHLGLPLNLRGRFVHLVTFPDNQACQHFYPDRTLAEHERICAALMRTLAKRGARITRTMITPGMFPQSASPNGDTRRLADAYNYLVPR